MSFPCLHSLVSTLSPLIFVGLPDPAHSLTHSLPHSADSPFSSAAATALFSFPPLSQTVSSTQQPSSARVGRPPSLLPLIPSLLPRSVSVGSVSVSVSVSVSPTETNKTHPTVRIHSTRVLSRPLIGGVLVASIDNPDQAVKSAVAEWSGDSIAHRPTDRPTTSPHLHHIRSEDGILRAGDREKRGPQRRK